MIFSSLLFIFLFLPLFLTIYYIAPRRARNLVALVGSYFFYAWGAPRFALALFGTTLVNYVFGKLIYQNERIPRRKKRIMAVAIIANVGLLFYFKYANFFVAEANNFLNLFGVSSVSWTAVALPIGISFFTFHEVSYLVDVYRRVVAPARSLSQFALYIVLFPQLIAGPIIRYHDIADQLKERFYGSEKFLDGVWRFCLGLGSKVLIANTLAPVADAVFALGSGSLTTGYAWLGIFAYTLQIYFDFAGYSNMAIGLGKMMGFDFLENFNFPYISRTFTEFWTRWHISLSRWMKEYLYVPLGGNRISPKRTVINLWLVFLLSGFWHGASLNFIFWGAYHGFFISLDKVGWKKIADHLPGFASILLNFFLIMIGWIFFRSESLKQSFSFISRMFGFYKSGLSTPVLWPDIIGYRGIFILGVGIIITFAPAFFDVKPIKRLSLKLGFAAVLFALSVATLANASFNPFIYFRF